MQIPSQISSKHAGNGDLNKNNRENKGIPKEVAMEYEEVAGEEVWSPEGRRMATRVDEAVGRCWGPWGRCGLGKL